MSDPSRDTIFALSSGRPPAAIAVVRISGPRARVALETLAGRLPSPRQASLARLRDPSNGEIIDEALALWFPSPRSETGEDMAELQLHGGRAVIAAIIAVLSRLEGFRPAEAGEFTRWAFENGRLDLTAVEGLADLIGAETEAQRRQAFRQLKGMLGDRAETWRTRLIEALALVEAGIDFSDEGDVPQNLTAPALNIARALHEEISAVLAQAGRGERLREGLVVAIAGPPNAGKSTLLNRIARREAAIVSPHAGTTRDVIEVHLDLDGYPVTLLDTAGVRETDDPVEQEGVRRARERAAAADLVLWVVDATSSDAAGFDRPLAHGQSGHRPKADLAAHAGRRSGPRPMAELASPLADPQSPPVWIIRNKADLLPAETVSGRPLDEAALASRASPRLSSGNRPPELPASPDDSLVVPSQRPDLSTRRSRHEPLPSPQSVPQRRKRSEYKFGNEFKFIYSISALEGSGLEKLFQGLKVYVSAFFGAESGLITRERHRHALQEAQAALGRAIKVIPGREEILAEELRLASRALGRLTGKVDVEDILDVIFRDFCIGK